jgi:glycosyltransferase involved in cell wall biosynthesis
VRILLVNWQDRLNPQAGGAEIHLHEIFGRLVARGAEVTLLASGWPGAAPRERVDGLEVVRSGSRYTFGLAAPRTHRRELAARPFDVVVEALNKVPVFTPLWGRRPVVLLVHHLFGTTAFQEASFPLAAMTWVLERPLGRVYRGLPAQAISRSTRDDLVARGLRARDVEVIYPGVDLEFFTPAKTAGRCEEPTFLYLGRLKRYKGIDTILRALARMRDGGVDARLLVGGRGEWERELRRLTGELALGDRVEFLGYVSEQRKRELFRSCWANVFPSPKEGWGITNLEAAACGTATVASDSPGLRESVVHEATGLLVPHGDVRALAATLARLARDPGLVHRLGSGALEFSSGFGWDRAASETGAHLERVVSAAVAPAHRT